MMYMDIDRLLMVDHLMEDLLFVYYFVDNKYAIEYYDL